MLCRASALSSAVTSAAYLPGPLNERQVQSIYHALIREGKKQNLTPPTQEEYLEGIERFALRVRSKKDLSEVNMDSILERLEKAKATSPLKGSTWFALANLDSAVQVAQLKLDEKISTVATAFGLNEDKVSLIFNLWRENGGASFEDRPAPDSHYRYDLEPGMPTDKATAIALRKLGYEHYLIQPYPVFVYGTLRKGQGNHVILEAAATQIDVGRAKGVGVYGDGRSFPYAKEHSSAEVFAIGEVIELDPVLGISARHDLDYLESFDSDAPSDSHYERVLRPIEIESEFVVIEVKMAWMYLATQLVEEDRIQDGDWVTLRNKVQTMMKEKSSRPKEIEPDFYQQLRDEENRKDWDSF
jgi:gamma-glutamylcyclotransferase (GGCT)/AIG2-like uncharacterized protein YtfP